jgi:5-methylcytosine-specific restriction endonuclease McrA
MAISKTTRAIVNIRDGASCVLCGRFSDDLHHVEKRSQGGSDNPQNLVSLCRICHENVHENDSSGELYQKITEYVDDYYANW